LIIGLAGSLVLFFLLSLFVLPFASEGERSLGARTASAAIQAVWELSLVLLVYKIVRRYGSTWKDLGLRLPRWWVAGRPGYNLRRLIQNTVVAYVASYGVLLVYGLLVSLLDLDFLKPSKQLEPEFFSKPWLQALIGLSVVVVAPFAESVFFQGFMYGGLRRYLPVLPAALFSGLIFSLAHVNPGLILPFTVIGALFAIVYERSGSLYATIAVHFVFNTVAFSVLLLFPDLR
jgi:membrane protease YdiL (CAAX protease family)